MSKYYPSAKSLLLGLILWGILFSSFGLAFYQIIVHAGMQDLIVLLIISFIVLSFVGIIWFGTGYFVSDDFLIVKIGPITHSKIRISTISNISRSRSLLASPANSLNRLAIKSGKRTIVQISPRDEDAFIKSIIEVNSQIRINL
jgi:hypothetical protein